MKTGKKSAISILLALIIALSCFAPAFAADSETTPDACTVYVTIVDKGEFAMTAMPIGVIDIDNDNVLTVNDALYCAHEAYFEGGAASGYGYAVSAYGLSMTKLWGQTNNGSFGYYLDNNMCWSLADTVKDGANLVAFLYKDTAYWSDAFTFFDKPIVSASGDEVELTLSKYAYDADWNLVAAPMANAKIDVSFESDDTYITDENGKVTVPVTEEGYYSLNVTDEDYLVPALCYMPASATETTVENHTAATCTENGSATVNGNAISIPATGHVNAEAVKENEKAATCTENGSYDTVVYCSVCNNEISRETTEIPATGHDAADAVRENEVAAEYNKEGSYDSVVYCKTCGAEISRETVSVSAKTGFMEAVRYYFAKVVEAVKTAFSFIVSLFK